MKFDFVQANERNYKQWGIAQYQIGQHSAKWITTSFGQNMVDKADTFEEV